MTDRDYLPPTIDWVRKQVEVYEVQAGTLTFSKIAKIKITIIENRSCMGYSRCAAACTSKKRTKKEKKKEKNDNEQRDIGL